MKTNQTITEESNSYHKITIDDLDLITLELQPDGYVLAEWIEKGEVTGQFFPKKAVMRWILERMQNSRILA